MLDPADLRELGGRAGHDIVTSSGDTLLGADDKAGVAEIVTAVAHLAAHPELPRPTLRVGFTPDEEIGEGASLFDIEGFGAALRLHAGRLEPRRAAGRDVHCRRGDDPHRGRRRPSRLRHGPAGQRRRASPRASSRRCPSDRLTPETTSGREGFIHLFEMTATPARATLEFIVRDFDDGLLDEHVALLRHTADEVMATEPRATLEFDARRQYPNMRTYLDAFPEVVTKAEQAIRAEGIEPVRNPIRGGTDGSMLSAKGLPTPNIFAGGHEFHSVREWASVQDMAAAAAVVVHLARLWTEA